LGRDHSNGGEGEARVMVRAMRVRERRVMVMTSTTMTILSSAPLPSPSSLGRLRRAWERKGDSDDLHHPTPPHVSLTVHAIAHAHPWPSSFSTVLLLMVTSIENHRGGGQGRGWTRARRDEGEEGRGRGGTRARRDEGEEDEGEER